MKAILTFLIILLSTNSYSQKWNFRDIDETKEFGFVYTFSFQNEDEVSEMKFDESISCNKTKIVGKISDHKKNNMGGSNIKIKSKKKDFEQNIIADFNGKFELIIDDGEYIIEISYVGFDKIISDFKIKDKAELKFNIILGRGPELLVYQINSKEKLTDDKINGIINCVKQKRKKRKFITTECSDEKEYKVTMHG